ncbi:hypothetical protein D3C79_946840 [compost metagenome]
MTCRSPKRAASAASSSSSLSCSTWANERISAREATSNNAGLSSFSGHRLRSRLTWGEGAACTARLSRAASKAEAIRTVEGSATAKRAL